MSGPTPLPFALGERPLDPETVSRVARGEQSVLLSEDRGNLLDRRHRALTDIDGRRLYGMHTGFGPLACEDAGDEPTAHQLGLVAHLGSGVGPRLSPTEARAVLVVRGHMLAQGLSGASRPLVQAIVDFLEAGAAPSIPSLGSVGASGDLTPLAHAALSLLGLEEVWWQGAWHEGSVFFRRAGLEPCQMRGRDGLAFVNGTSATAALASLSEVELWHALERATQHAVAYAEVLGGRSEAWHPLPAQRRPHPGQASVQEALAQAGRGSHRVERGLGSQAREGHPQDAYTLRCAQQVLGAASDVLRQHRDTLGVELNAITDNPLFDFDDDDRCREVVHGGNFMGLHMAFAQDHLHNALLALAAFVERRINRMTHPGLSAGLPPFLTGVRPGAGSGLMGAQVTASALVAELRTRSVPASVQSIPTNGDNQDFVPMATVGARRMRESLARLRELLAIEAIALAQAVDLRGGPESGFSPSTQDLYARVRSQVPPLKEDRPLSAAIRMLAGEMLAPFVFPDGQGS